jgi:hypothetical protein
MLGAVQGIANYFLTKGANKKLNNVWQQDPSYTFNPLVPQMFANNQNAYLDPSFGTRPQVARDIQTTGANFGAGVGRNATDGSQALALLAAGQGQTDNAISNANLDFTKNKFGLLSNLNNAYAQMIGEGDKVFNDKVRRFGDYTSIEGAKVQNRASGINGIFNGINSDYNDILQIAGMAMGMPTMGAKKAPQAQQPATGGWSR